MQRLESEVRNFRRRAALTSALATGARFLALWLLLWGTAVLALRAGFEAPRAGLLWGVAGAIPVAIAALFLGFRRRPSRSSVRSLLDLHGAGGGLMMAAGEVELGAWRDALGVAQAPRLRARYPWRALSAGAAFVAAAFLMPVAPVGLIAERPLEVGEEIAVLNRRVEVLEQEGLLDEPAAERFSAELETLADEASGQDPAATWEALDHLQEMTDRAADEVAEAALAEGEQLAAAEAVAEALSLGGDGATGQTATEAMAQLSALTARAAEDSRLLDSKLAAELNAAAGGPQLDLGKLLDALGRGKGSLEDKLDRLHAGGLIDLETLDAARRALGGEDLDQLAQYLEDNGLEAAGKVCRGGPGSWRPGSGPGRGGVGSGRPGSGPGRGGVGRGRGDAPMTWKEPSSPDGARWREQVLDPSSLAALHQSHLLGLTAADPGALETPPVATAGALDPVATAGGGAAYTHTLLPRHRGAVERYFDRTTGSPEPASGATGSPAPASGATDRPEPASGATEDPR